MLVYLKLPLHPHHLWCIQLAVQWFLKSFISKVLESRIILNHHDHHHHDHHNWKQNDIIIITTWKWRNKNTVSTWSCLFNFTVIRSEWKFSGPNLDNSSLHCLHKSKRVCANKGSRAWIVLFIAIVLFSRIKSFPQNLCLRSVKNSSSVSKLDPRNSILENWNLKLEAWNSILENFEDRESSFELKLSTYLWVVLYLISISKPTLSNSCSVFRILQWRAHWG